MKLPQVITEDMSSDDVLIMDANPEDVGKCPEGVDPLLWVQWKNEDEVKKDQFLWQLKRGGSGQNIGLDNGLSNINKYIYGTHKARYYLIGAESSVGKTTIGDFMYVFNAWASAKRQGRKIRILYLSFEIGRVDKLFRWASYYIFMKHGVRLPSDYLQGRIHGKLPTTAHQQMVLEAYSIITEMLKDVTIVQDSIHPTAIFESVITVLEGNGTVHRAEISEADKKKNKKGYVTGYTETDPNAITILYADHLALAASEMHLETKGIMDKLSKYAIVLRNLFHVTVIFIQQFSTDMMSTYRGNFGKKDAGSITPQRIDFGDSKATFRDADVVFGAVKPQKDMENFMGYNLSKFEGLGDCFVALYLMKNRYGPANRMLPLFLDGAAGIAYDLPLEPNNILAMEPWYQKAYEIEKLCQEFSPQAKPLQPV